MIAPRSVGMGPIKQCFFVPTMFVLTNAPVLHMIVIECKNYEIRVLYVSSGRKEQTQLWRREKYVRWKVQGR